MRRQAVALLALAACACVTDPTPAPLPDGATEISRPEFAGAWATVTECSGISLEMSAVRFYVAPYPLATPGGSDAAGFYRPDLKAIVYSEVLWTTRSDIPQFDADARDDVIRHEMLHAKLYTLGYIGRGHPTWVLDRCGPSVINPKYWHD